jgi:hypothetical protein
MKRDMPVTESWWQKYLPFTTKWVSDTYRALSYVAQRLSGKTYKDLEVRNLINAMERKLNSTQRGLEPTAAQMADQAQRAQRPDQAFVQQQPGQKPGMWDRFKEGAERFSGLQSRIWKSGGEFLSGQAFHEPHSLITVPLP